MTGTASNFLYTSPQASSNKSYFGQLKRTTGIGFGGEIGKERLWIDEDFMGVTVRHHAVDKTYETGHLVPDQVSIFLSVMCHEYQKINLVLLSKRSPA